MAEDPKKDRIILKRLETLKEARVKAARYCAYQERTQQQVREKLLSLGLTGDETEEVLTDLIREDFVNEERFARTFAGSKFRLKKWGRLKIIQELERRDLTPYCINKGLEEIDEEDYLHTLRELLTKKMNALQDKNLFSKRNKASRYVIGKGYEPDIVWSILKSEFEE